MSPPAGHDSSRVATIASAHPAASSFKNTAAQVILPPEVWTWIIQHVAQSPTDLFSLYNTSASLRILVAPFLVQAIASKSLRLFFYQEYVCRTGITFDFHHFDMARDRVVFKPQRSSAPNLTPIPTRQSRSKYDNSNNVIAFKTGITIQRPQLEEISITSRGSRYRGGRVHRSEEGIYSIRRRGNFHAISVAPGISRRNDINSGVSAGTTASGTVEDKPDTSASTNSKDKLGFLSQYADGGFGSLDYLDRVCPLHIKRTGTQLLSGAQHSFGQNYPWALHYVIEDGKSCSPETDGSNSNNSSDDDATHQRGHPRNARRGSRFMHAVKFECSINFLDPRRASRSLFRRWLEGKMSQLLQMVRTRQTTTPAIHPRKARSHHSK
ncbi:hypothetical protein BGZ98_004482, partial [Dissophora globulifera]